MARSTTFIARLARKPHDFAPSLHLQHRSSCGVDVALRSCDSTYRYQGMATSGISRVANQELYRL